MIETTTMWPPSPMDSEAQRKVQIIYYLSRRGQLEHPHLLQLALPPSQGVTLRDVKKRLTATRGNSMPSSFAWSYKRSYKNGYVWQDIGDDDLIFPAHGCEYILKGSQILDIPVQLQGKIVEECINGNSKALTVKTAAPLMALNIGADMATQTEVLTKPVKAERIFKSRSKRNQHAIECDNTTSANDVIRREEEWQLATADFPSAALLNKTTPSCIAPQCDEGLHDNSSCLQERQLNYIEAAAAPIPVSKAKQMAALTSSGIFHFASCAGGLDIKDRMIHMPLHLRTVSDKRNGDTISSDSSRTRLWYSSYKRAYLKSSTGILPNHEKSVQEINPTNSAGNLQEEIQMECPPDSTSSEVSRELVEESEPECSSSSSFSSETTGKISLPIDPVAQRMATLWEKLLAPKRDQSKNKDDRRLIPGRSEVDWEQALKKAVEASLPPPDFHELLQSCGNCGRKFRPEPLIVHARGCWGRSQSSRNATAN